MARAHFGNIGGTNCARDVETVRARDTERKVPMPDTPYRTIPLRRVDGSTRAEVIVDEADYDWLSQWRWSYIKSWRAYAYRSLKRGGKRYTLMMHRVILGLEPGDAALVDHINGNGLDNRRANLRPCTKSENAQNLGDLIATNTSGYRGVHWETARKKWVARGIINGEHHFLGRFATAEEAAVVAAAWRTEHMPFAPH